MNRRTRDAEMVAYDSDEAASFITGIDGWVDRHGRFWGKDERMARWSGCTHTACSECGDPIKTRGYTLCGKCRKKSRSKKYYAMPSIKWDGETPLYSDSSDEYFFDADQIFDYTEEHECTVGSMQLIVCQPNMFRELDSEYFCAELPEDGEIPAALTEALAYINEVISAQPPASWSPGKFAAEVAL